MNSEFNPALSIVDAPPNSLRFLLSSAIGRTRQGFREVSLRFGARDFAALVLVGGFALHSTNGYALEFNVNRIDDTVDAAPGDGVCADVASMCSLRAAVQETNALAGADTIRLGSATHTLSRAGIDEDAADTGDLDITDDLDIIGAGSADTRIDAAGLDAILDLLTSTTMAVHIEGLTLRGGSSTVNSSERKSAGMRVAAGVAVDLLDVVIRDNRMTTFNGGAAIENAGCIHGERVRIIDNGDFDMPTSSSVESGGISVHGATSCLHLVDSEISGNRGDQAGAIMLFDQPVVSMRRSLITNNRARFSGAILASDAQSVLLENVTISENRGNPGAILNDGGTTLQLIHCTVTGNSASDSQAIVGGIQDVHGGSGRTFLSNTILSGNGPGFLADDCVVATSVGGGNLVGDCDRFSAAVNDQVGVNPEFAVLDDHGGFTRTYLPPATAIDFAADTTCTATDQRGLARPVDGDGDGIARCDSGAVEVNIDPLFADGFDPA